MRTTGNNKTLQKWSATLILATSAAILLGLASQSEAALVPPFNQAPPVGNDTSAAVLIVVNSNGTGTILHDPTQGPYDGIEDTLVAVQNNTGGRLNSIALSSATAPLFGFDGDGIQTYLHPANPTIYGPTGYEGPGVSFTITDQNHGVVNFLGGLDPGMFAYFGLEDDVTGAGVIQFSAPVIAAVPEPASGLAGLGCLFLIVTSLAARRAERARVLVE